MSGTAGSRLAPWDRLAAAGLAVEAARRGLVVTRPDGGEVPIGISATPITITAAELERRRHLARQLASAGTKMAGFAVSTPMWRSLIVSGLSPGERAFVDRVPRGPSMLATTRVDFFTPRAGGLAALELNATIPAMQGYSDIAVSALLDVSGAVAGVPPAVVAGWKARQGENALALWRALLSGYRQARAGREPGHVVLLCRRHDPQISELRYLARRWAAAAGVVATVAHPDQLALVDDVVYVDGRAVELVYRHLFVRRLDEPGGDPQGVVRRLLQGASTTGTLVLNPPASQVEVKTIFAMLSRAASDDRLAEAAGLDADERAAVVATVPWTRLLGDAEALARVAADPDGVVLKRAWDYGGRTVIIGHDRGQSAFTERVRSAWPDAADDVASGRDWAALVALAAADTRGGGFIAQARVDAAPTPQLVCTPTKTRSIDAFVDFSVYASVGLDHDPGWGGVCRASTSNIVNIVGGGGVAPLLLHDVAAEVADVLAATPRRTVDSE
jgi:hypothetical protein